MLLQSILGPLKNWNSKEAGFDCATKKMQIIYFRIMCLIVSTLISKIIEMCEEKVCKENKKIKFKSLTRNHYFDPLHQVGHAH